MDMIPVQAKVVVVGVGQKYVGNRNKVEEYYTIVSTEGNIREMRDYELIDAMRKREIAVNNIKMMERGVLGSVKVDNQFITKQERALQGLCDYLGVEYTTMGLYYGGYTGYDGEMSFKSYKYLKVPWKGFVPRLSITVVQDSLAKIGIYTDFHDIEFLNLPLRRQLENTRGILERWRIPPSVLARDTRMRQRITDEVKGYEVMPWAGYELDI